MPQASLQPPDSVHLDAAKGWCELRAYLEANEELEKIAPQLRAHPAVLEVRWQIYANLQKWEGALNIAAALARLRPDWPDAWIYQASSLCELNRHQEAYQVLSEAVAMFPGDEIVLYDLACICCALKRVEEARSWLSKAIDVGGDQVKLRALDDPDLEAVWKREEGR